MTFSQTPQEGQLFDHLCARVEEYEPLPEVVPGPGETTPQLSADAPSDSIDAEILAGLVSP